ncbi:cuticle protein-like [Sitodiplosis mosellana]|uniref:cuticle protein-like n=1 Tax=Sitodiplosis mosellana TaxID=263140 RepID=UPI00244528D1|nr:cuticle protein-like [Sitodiplosis mosellana]
MAFKFVAFAVLIAVANAGLLPAAPAVVHQPATIIQQRYVQPAPVLQQIATPVLAKHDDEYDPNPQYSYSYDIHDSLTGDAKTQQETRSGDVVQGQYTVVDADGFRRIVDYTADPIHGFNAVVNREPLTKAVAVAPIAHQPAVIAAKTVLPAQPFAYQAQPFAYQAQPIAYQAQPLLASKTILPAQPLAYAAQPVLQQQLVQAPLYAKAAYH